MNLKLIEKDQNFEKNNTKGLVGLVSEVCYVYSRYVIERFEGAESLDCLEQKMIVP